MKNKSVVCKTLTGIIIASSITLSGCDKINNSTESLIITNNSEDLCDTFVIRKGTIEYYDENGEYNTDIPKINLSTDYLVAETNEDGQFEIETYSGRELAQKMAQYWGVAAMEFIDAKEFPIIEYVGRIEKETSKHKIRI